MRRYLALVLCIMCWPCLAFNWDHAIKDSRAYFYPKFDKADKRIKIVMVSGADEGVIDWNDHELVNLSFA